jgi:hypothetical protein
MDISIFFRANISESLAGSQNALAFLEMLAWTRGR